MYDVPVMAWCPGSGSQFPSVSVAGVVVVVALGSLLETMRTVHPASDYRSWETNILVVVRASEVAEGASLEPSVRKIMTILWSRSWGKASVLVAGHELATLYKMAPIPTGSGLCGSEEPSVVAVASVRLDRLSSAALPAMLYEEGYVLPRNLHGCVMRATLVVGYPDRCADEGDLPVESKVTQSVMTAMARYRNVTVEWRYVPDVKSFDFPNGTFFGPLSGLATGDTDVVVGPFGLTPTRMKYLQPTLPFLQMPIHIVTRCPETDAAWPHVWDVLLRNMWGAGMRLLTFLTAVAACATVALRVAVARVAAAGAVSHGPGWALSVASSAVLDLWAKTCEVAAPAWPLCPRMLTARVLTGTWLLYLLTMNVAVKSLLLTESSLLTSLPLPPTVNELLVAVPNLTIAIENDFIRINLAEADVPLEQVVTCETQQEAQRRVALQNNAPEHRKQRRIGFVQHFQVS